MDKPVGLVGLHRGSAPTSWRQFSASGGSGGYTFNETGTLDGLTLSPAGLLSGTPTAAGTFPIIVTATDSDNGTGSQNYSLVIDPAIVTLQ